ncbi:MAG: hypothetical protein RJA81_1239 [Planctomycetota bacterium]
MFSKSVTQQMHIVSACILITVATVSASGADFSNARIILPVNPTRQNVKAVEMLVKEVQSRTRLNFSVEPRSLNTAVPEIIILRETEVGSQLPNDLQKTRFAGKPEGFTLISTEKPARIYVIGHDDRGILFGIGRLLRELRLERDRATLESPLSLTTSPVTPLRGHQLGYRPKTNSYDAWDIGQWEQYFRDLIAFGTNAVELIPPRSDDDPDSQHFPRPQLEMMTLMSRLADDYGLDVWIWYPAIDGDYADLAQVEFALREWEIVFQALPRIDAIFVPGGDPGHMRPVHMMTLLERQTASLKKHHPNAEMWMSPQSFDRQWFAEFVEIMKSSPTWLNGIVFGPQNQVDLQTLRSLIPSKYPIRGYPDITHNIMCQHPVPNWDFAFALTQGREAINPRPVNMSEIFRSYAPYTMGFISYSEGCHDDVNKIVWSALGWNPDSPVREILKSYARFFIGPDIEESFADALMGLENNWQAPAVSNSVIEDTYERMVEIERTALPSRLRNWRFQQVLYRSIYDAWLKRRCLAETAAQRQAESVLRSASLHKTIPYIEKAIAILTASDTEMVSPDLRRRTDELAEALFQSPARMQLATVKYHGMRGRGTSQDQIDVPLNDRPWLIPQLKSITTLPTENERYEALRALLTRTEPGPGGYYDDLGDITRQPHLVPPTEPYFKDTDFRRSPFTGFEYRLEAPIAWCRYIQTMYDTPIVLKYDHLDPTEEYELRVTYAGDNFRVNIQAEADGRLIHGPIKKPNPHRTLTFAIPKDLTADGKLELKFNRELGLGGNGRGCQVAEVWVMKKTKK